MQTDSELESDTSSINEGITGSSLSNSGANNAVLFMNTTSSSSNLPSSSVGGGGQQSLEKRIETLVQENRVLKMEIETYKLRIKSLQEENKELRKASVNIQARAEQEEEYISNKLLKKIQLLKKEKETLANNYEREEEYLTNDLSRKLNQLRNEKVQLEQTLEQEQEQMVNKLMRKIDKLEAETSAKQTNLEQLRREKIELENTLEQEQESLVNRLWKRMERLEAEKRLLQDKLENNSLNNSTNSLGSASGNSNFNLGSTSLLCGPGPLTLPPTMITAGAASILTTSNNASAALLSLVGLPANPASDQATNLTEHIINLRREVSRLKATLEKAERDHRENISKIVRDETRIKEENIRLQRRLQMEVDRREALCRHLSESESSLEMDDERHFNESSRVRTISSPIPTHVQQQQATQSGQAGGAANTPHQSQHKTPDVIAAHCERCPTCNQAIKSIISSGQTGSVSNAAILMSMNPSSPPAHHHLHGVHSVPMNIVTASGGSVSGMNNNHNNAANPLMISNSMSASGRQSATNLLNASSSLSSSSSSINSSNRNFAGMNTQTSGSQLDMLKK